MFLFMPVVNETSFCPFGVGRRLRVSNFGKVAVFVAWCFGLFFFTSLVHFWADVVPRTSWGAVLSQLVKSL